ncbi:MAG: hypothetical protein IPN15_01495 [Saprospiraceae bacterium]|nr:hypothetical protein [Candidatus Vicinibacter affinis]
MIDFVGGWQKDGKNVLTNIYSHDKVYSYEQENFIYCESREGIYHNPATINHRKIILLGNPVRKLNFNEEWDKLYHINFDFESHKLITFFNSVSGIAGLIIHDEISENIYIITDPLGFIPIFIIENETGLVYTNRLIYLNEIFKSELVWDENSIRNYYENGHFISHQTWFKSTRRVKAATVLKHCLINNKTSEFRYWSWQNVSLPHLHSKMKSNSLITLFEKGIKSLDLKNQKTGIALSGGRDSRWITWFLRDVPAIETFTFGIKNSADLKIAQICSKVLNLKNVQYELTYKNWFADRKESFLIGEGLLSLEHFHEGNILRKLSKNYNILVSGFFGGFSPHYKKQRITSKEAKTYFRFQNTDTEVQDSFYNFKSPHPYLIDQKMTNLATIHLYILSRYFKVATPFYNMEWITFLYSCNKSYLKDQKLYLSALNSSMPTSLSNIPWQKTGIPLSWVNANLFILKFRLNDILEKILNIFHKTRSFYNYNLLENEIDSLIQEYKSGSVDFLKQYKPHNLQSKFRLLSILVWIQNLEKTRKYEN